MELTSQLEEYVCCQLLDEKAVISPGTSLFEGKILDSMKLVELIGFLETQYAIRVKALDITVENLDTIEKMAEFVRRKQNE